MLRPRPDLTAIGAHLLQQEARLRMQADLLGTLIGLMANVAGEQKNELLDVVHEAGLRATDQEERSGHALDQESARAMRQELVRIMAIAKAAAGVES